MLVGMKNTCPIPSCCPLCGAPISTPARPRNQYPHDTSMLPQTYTCRTSSHESGHVIDYCTPTLPRDQMGRVQGRIRNPGTS